MAWTEKDNVGYFIFTSVKGKINNFEKVTQFTYLARELYIKPNIREEIQKELSAGNKCVGALRRLMNNKNVRKLKVKMYKTVIRPIITYGSEVWTHGLSRTKHA